MSQEKLIELDKELTEQAQYIVQKHIDELNRQFREVIDQQIAEHEKFTIFNKRSTWLVWIMFWISGFLARGFFQGPMEWQLVSFATGISTGVCVYFTIYAGVQWMVLRHKMKGK
jgi:hypothetical protein